jgi:hypothetical protein
MAAFKLVCLCLGFATTQGFRISQRKYSKAEATTAIDATTEEKDAQEAMTSDAWWDSLNGRCRKCILDEVVPELRRCKARCQSTTAGSLTLGVCQRGCKSKTGQHARTVAGSHCSRLCQDARRTTTLWKPNLLGLQAGGSRGALIPGLVPRRGQKFEIELHSRPRPVWRLTAIKNVRGRLLQRYYNGQLASVEGGHMKRCKGLKYGKPCKYFIPAVVRDKNGRALFSVRSAKRGFTWAWTFRIMNPHNEDFPLYTIRRDVYGKGMLGQRGVWRIYRGRESDNILIYYCAEGKVNADIAFHHSEEEYRRHTPYVALLSHHSARAQMAASNPYNASFYGYARDQQMLTVNAGEDTALLLTTAMIIQEVSRR